MSGLLTDDERTDLCGAINFWDDDIEDAGWQVIEDIVRRRMKQAWDEGFMNAAGQDHPAYPRTRRIDNPYAT